eukprot:scaffold75727_cov66-Phaeocystis_antarctica.AAC.2
MSVSRLELEAHHRPIREPLEAAVALVEPVLHAAQQVDALRPQRLWPRVHGGRAQWVAPRGRARRSRLVRARARAEVRIRPRARARARARARTRARAGVRVEIDARAVAHGPPPQRDAQEQPRLADVAHLPRVASQPVVRRAQLAAEAEAQPRALHVRASALSHVCPGGAARAGEEAGHAGRGGHAHAGRVALAPGLDDGIPEAVEQRRRGAPLGRVEELERLDERAQARAVARHVGHPDRRLEARRLVLVIVDAFGECVHRDTPSP